jgi:hypothetical protein
MALHVPSKHFGIICPDFPVDMPQKHIASIQLNFSSWELNNFKPPQAVLFFLVEDNTWHMIENRTI